MFEPGMKKEMDIDTDYLLTGSVSVSTNNMLAKAYTYDPLGRRISTTTVEGIITVFCAYDGIHCAADLDASGNLLMSYTYGPGIDNLLAVTLYGGDAPETYHAITDRLGTIHALADTSGNIVESYQYDAWGNVLSHFSTLELSNFSLRVLFQGREYSHATGLYNFRARWYDPVTGRWLSNDPIGISGGLNQYMFCGNNPVNCIDPYGEDFLEEFGDVIAEPMNNASRNIRNGIGSLRNWIFGEPEPKCEGSTIGPGRPDPFSRDDVTDAIFFFAGVRGMGPSGKLKIHKIPFSTQKAAKDAARAAGKGSPMKHPSPKEGPPHYHPVDKGGNKIPDGTHYEY